MIQKLDKMLRARPFQAFTVALADGRRFNVPARDLAWLPANGRGGLHFFDPEKDCLTSVNPTLMISVEPTLGGLAKGTPE